MIKVKRSDIAGFIAWNIAMSSAFAYWQASVVAGIFMFFIVATFVVVED